MILRYAAYEEIKQSIRETLKEISENLNSHGVPHAVVGGVAMGAYISGRSTDDIDILIDIKNKSTLMRMYPGGNEVEPELLAIKLPMYQVEIDGIDVDFILGSKLPRDILSDPSYQDGVPVISRHALTALKVRSGRDKDQIDVVRLVRSELKKHQDIQKRYFSNLKKMDQEDALEVLFKEVLSLNRIKNYLEIHDLQTSEGESSLEVFKRYTEEALAGLHAPERIYEEQKPEMMKSEDIDLFDQDF